MVAGLQMEIAESATSPNATGVERWPDTGALGHIVVRERMNVRRRPIASELIRRLEFEQISLGGIQVFLTAVLLVAFPFLSCVALAQDSIGTQGASTAAQSMELSPPVSICKGSPPPLRVSP